MRRMAIFGAIFGVGALVLRARGAQLHERLIAHCEAMFERMPATFPPKKMMRGIEEIRANTSRILDLLEADEETAAKAKVPDATSREAVHHVA